MLLIDDVLVTLSVPTTLQDGTIQYSQPLNVYVDCQNINNDSAIIERNNITYDGYTPLNQEIGLTQ